MKEKEKRGRGCPKGLPKSGGRVAGTPNKTDEIKNKIRLFLNTNFEKAIETWEKIDCPKQKFDAYVSVMPYVYPKMRSIEVSDMREKTSIEEKLAQMTSLTGSTSNDAPEATAINL